MRKIETNGIERKNCLYFLKKKDFSGSAVSLCSDEITKLSKYLQGAWNRGRGSNNKTSIAI